MIGTIIVASFAALLAMFRVWRAVFWGRPMQHVPHTLRVRASLVAPAATLLAISVLMFLGSGPLMDALHAATESLLDVSSYQESVLGAAQ